MPFHPVVGLNKYKLVAGVPFSPACMYVTWHYPKQNISSMSPHHSSILSRPEFSILSANVLIERDVTGGRFFSIQNVTGVKIVGYDRRFSFLFINSDDIYVCSFTTVSTILPIPWIPWFPSVPKNPEQEPCDRKILRSHLKIFQGWFLCSRFLFKNSVLQRRFICFKSGNDIFIFLLDVIYFAYWNPKLKCEFSLTDFWFQFLGNLYFFWWFRGRVFVFLLIFDISAFVLCLFSYNDR